MSLLQPTRSFAPNRLLSWAFLLLLTCCLPAGCGAKAGTMGIGRLGSALVVDGDLSEWSAAVGVPIMAASDVVNLREDHEWNGVRDAGAMFLCAWNDDGLCLAAVVSDDDVRNNRNAPNYYQQDCVEFMVDARTGESFGKSPYSRGAYQILVKPPVGGRTADACLNPRDGKIDGLQAAGKRTAGGYLVEVFVPWSAFPGFEPKPGAKLGLHFALDDSDATDGELNQPMQMLFRGVRYPPVYPESIAKWELRNACPTGDDAVAASTEFDVPNIEYERAKTLSFHLVVAQPLSKIAESVRLELLGKNGKPRWASTVGLSKVSDALPGVVAADFSCPSKGLPLGSMTARATLLGQGKTVAVVTRTLYDLRHLSAAGTVDLCAKLH